MAEIQISQFDRCPACGRKVLKLVQERGGILRGPCGCIICRCGNCFFTRAMIDQTLQQAQSPIIQPDGNSMKFVRKL